jgi:nicotinamide riboside kinase
VIALLGAESTGKTTLCQALAGQLQAQGHSVGVVPEYLRQWCEARGRTPRPDEQAEIADEQGRRIWAAAEHADWVLADTTALMTAVYSELLFDDCSLYATALAEQRRMTLTLLTGLDLPWVPDGLQRDGPHVRQTVDDALRQALTSAALPYTVVYGQGSHRVAQAMAAVQGVMNAPVATPSAARWRWVCADCDDGDCERDHQHRWLPRA